MPADSSTLYLDERGSGSSWTRWPIAADGLGWPALEVALAWVRDRLGVTGALLLGARTLHSSSRRRCQWKGQTLPDEICQ